MKNNLQFIERLKNNLPESYAILSSSNLTVHDRVTHVLLEGSRSLNGTPRPDSDIDISLIADVGDVSQEELVSVLDEITRTTIDAWKGDTELDLAVLFDERNCGLKCCFIEAWDENICDSSGEECFGIYKIMKGFSGIVKGAGVQVKLMYPNMVVWAGE